VVSTATGDPELGARLRSLRKDKGLALKAVAAAAGISLPFLSEIERGQKLPSLNVLSEVAAALGVSVVELLRGLPRYENMAPGPNEGGEHSR
jgi:transcriptional regulator with XRE-family HTH domain